ncbi:MAG: hypothetical protein ACR2K5_01145 [Pseudolabrys sp.]
MFSDNMPRAFAQSLPLSCFATIEAARRGGRNESRKMDPKLTMFFLLIGAIIGLSHLTDDRLARVRQQFAAGRWRTMVTRRRKS